MIGEVGSSEAKAWDGEIFLDPGLDWDGNDANGLQCPGDRLYLRYSTL